MEKVMIPDDLKLSVIMPVYNERDTVLSVVDTVLTVPIHKELIIVDNCSTDGTREMLAALDTSSLSDVQSADGGYTHKVEVIFHPENRGRGASVRTALDHCTGDYALIQDADLEYDPNEWHLLLEKALADNLDAVFGSRTMGGKAAYIYVQNYYGILFLNTVINLLYGSHYTDSGTAIKMIRTPVFKALKLECSGFDLDFEICTKLALAKCSFADVPITYRPRSIAQGKKLRAVRDGIAAMRVILRDRFSAAGQSAQRTPGSKAG